MFSADSYCNEEHDALGGDPWQEIVAAAPEHLALSFPAERECFL
jgi:hypothetical protein